MKSSPLVAALVGVMAALVPIASRGADGPAPKRRLVVLYASVQKEAREELTREGLNDALGPALARALAGLEVLWNTEDFLRIGKQQGVDLATLDEDGVVTGRALAATFVVQQRVVKQGKKLKQTLQLRAVSDGAVLSTQMISGGTGEQLEEQLAGVAKVFARAIPGATTRVIGPGAKVGVLDFKNFAAEVKIESVRYLVDLVRSAVLEAAPDADVITRENILLLAGPGEKDLSDCEAECEITTGRKLGADALITGDLQRIGPELKLSLRLHQTATARLIATSFANAATAAELEDSLRKSLPALLDPLRK